MRSFGPACLVLALSASCLPDRLGDAEGYGCRGPADCPSPFLCTEGVCRRSPGGPSTGNGDGGEEGDGPFVVVAASDIACDPTDPDFAGGQGISKVCRMADTAQLASEQLPTRVLPLGNLQLGDGALAKFQASYDLHWGQPALKAITRPVPGKAEYLTANAAGFFAQFPSLTTEGEGRGYYRTDLGPWRLYALNSNCDEPSVGGCGRDSPQGIWLRSELAQRPGGCALAYFYSARFSSTAPDPSVAPLWEMLYEGGVDLILSGGSQHYERFAPMTPTGTPDAANGIRSFIIGTGGARLGNVGTGGATTERVGASHGVLRLTLQPGGYAWRFIAVPDVPLDDSGQGTCH